MTRDRTEPTVRLDRHLQGRLDARRAEGLHRHSECLRDYDGASARRSDGTRVVVLCGNDYLGLAADPRLAEAMADAARDEGAGAGAAHLVTGHRRAHHELEERLAAWTGREDALLFSTGYMANLGVLTTLAGRGDRVCEDRLNHASLIDAVRLAGGRPLRVRHADPNALRTRLAAGGDRASPALVVTDGVFSMDGDVAPLPEMGRLADAAGATLVVDDAHGLGVIGARGRGSVEATGCPPEHVPVLVGTLGKAFGAFGAFVAGSATLIDALRQFARTYVYTTAPPPGVAAAARTGLRLAEAEPWRRAHLHELVQRFRTAARREGIPLADSGTPIQPVPLGSSARALVWSAELEARGLRVAAIRPPTVPDGQARLRISLTARHSAEDVDRLVEGLAAAARSEPNAPAQETVLE